MPFSYLQRRGLNVAWAANDEESVGRETALYDIVVLSRLAFPSAHAVKQWVKTCHKFGKTVIFDVDDDLLGYTEFISEALTAEQHEAMLHDLPMVRATMRYADGITCTNAYLAASINRRIGRPTAVVPNLLDWEWWESVNSKAKRLTPRSRTVIGWVGGRRNSLDLGVLAPAWTEVARARPDVRFCVAGYQAPALLEAVPKRRLTTIPWVDIWTYPASYASIDIGCCPLAPSLFNMSKSPIKAVEMAASRIPVVASPTVYAQALDSVAIASTTEEWVEKLLAIVDDPELARLASRRLYAEAYAKFSLQTNWLKFPAGWQAILDARAPSLVDEGVLTPS
jgi:glycosyltransferase involved in cell wall biosynthesis